MGVGGSRQSLFAPSLFALCLFALSLLAFSSLLATPALSVGIGVNKAEIRYEEVLQNGYAQEEILVTTDSDRQISGTWEFEGEVAPWLRVEPEQPYFNFSNGDPHRLTVIIEPPADAQLGSYTGGLRVLTGELERSEGGKIGTSTRAAFLIRIGAGLTGTQRLECKMGGVRLRDTEIGQPFDFLATIQNTGNVRIRPEFLITVYDQLQEEIVEEHGLEMEEEILPTVTSDFLTQVFHDLDPGQYWARIEAPLCDDQAFLTFDVLDRGGVADKGELLRIEASPWGRTGEIIPINAIFKNVGRRTVSASFTGTITKQDGERIYKWIETDPVNVEPGATARLETFFNPTEPGKYVAAGRVKYNNKLTFQKSAILNIEGHAMVAAANYGGVILLIIVILVVILIFLILIARKKRRRKRPGYPVRR